MISLPYYQHKKTKVSCHSCKWEGLGEFLEVGEMFDELYELHCPNCQERLVMISYPTFETTLKYGTEEEKEYVRKAMARNQAFEDTKLKRTSILPKIKGLIQLEFKERFTREQEKWLDMYINGKLVFSELFTYEYGTRLAEVLQIFSSCPQV